MARPRRGSVLLRAEVEGAGELARDFTKAQRALQDQLIRELRTVGVRGLERMRESAPVDSGDLRDQLRFTFYARAAAPRVTFVAPTKEGHPGAPDGYPYVAVTRFGHRKDRIYAKPGGLLSMHAPGRQSIETYRSDVRGVKVAEDWVATAERGIDREVTIAEGRIGRAVTTSLGAGRIR